MSNALFKITFVDKLYFHYLVDIEEALRLGAVDLSGMEMESDHVGD